MGGFVGALFVDGGATDGGEITCRWLLIISMAPFAGVGCLVSFVSWWLVHSSWGLGLEWLTAVADDRFSVDGAVNQLNGHTALIRLEGGGGSGMRWHRLFLFCVVWVVSSLLLLWVVRNKIIIIPYLFLCVYVCVCGTRKCAICLMRTSSR